MTWTVNEIIDDKSVSFHRHGLMRYYPARWLAIAFQPAAWIESRIRDEEVDLRPCGEHEIAY